MNQVRMATNFPPKSLDPLDVAVCSIFVLFLSGQRRTHKDNFKVLDINFKNGLQGVMLGHLSPTFSSDQARMEFSKRLLFYKP